MDRQTRRSVHRVLNMNKRDKALKAIKSDASERRKIFYHISGHIVRLDATISTQARGLSEGTVAEGQHGMDLLTLALRDLTRCAGLLQDFECDVDEALTSFDKLAPGHKSARDVLMHFDDYVIGAGNLQTALGKPATFSYERGGPEGNAFLHVLNPDLSVNLTVAVRGANDLAVALIEIIDKAISDLTPDPTV